MTEEQASEVLASFDAETQVDVIRRLVALDQTDPEILREVERGLKTRVAELIQDERRRAAGVAAVADILRVADPNIRRSILENLAEHDRPLARRLGRRDATFDDVERLADADLATVIARCDPEVLRLALAGASPRLADRVVNLLATREHKALRRALDRWEPTRLSDVEAAQAEVAKVAEQLFAEGMIELPGVSGSSLLLAA